eukprot:766772-Hanusia_phi.AAC.5
MIAVKFVPERKEQVVKELCGRLVELGRARKAVNILLAAGQEREAMRLILDHNLWAAQDEFCAQVDDEGLKKELRTAREKFEEDKRISVTMDTLSSQSTSSFPPASSVRSPQHVGSRNQAQVFHRLFKGATRWWKEIGQQLRKTKILYPLLAFLQLVTMMFLSVDDLATATFGRRSTTTIDPTGRVARILQPEHNWTVPLLLVSILVAMLVFLTMWICRERAGSYKQLIFSPKLFQLSLLCLCLSSLFEMLFLKFVLRWQFVLANHPLNGLYYSFRSLSLFLMAVSLKIYWTDFALFLLVLSVPIFYASGEHFRLAVYLPQLPFAAILCVRFYKAFQDVRLVLVPLFLSFLHVALSCILFYTNSVILHLLRDLFSDVLGCILLSAVFWFIPATMDWVQDDELLNLQAVGDAQTAKEEWEGVRAKLSIPKGFRSLYEVNKMQQDSLRLQQLVRGDDPQLFSQLRGRYGYSPVQAQQLPARRQELSRMKTAMVAGGYNYDRCAAAAAAAAAANHHHHHLHHLHHLHHHHHYHHHDHHDVFLLPPPPAPPPPFSRPPSSPFKSSLCHLLFFSIFDWLLRSHHHPLLLSWLPI